MYRILQNAALMVLVIIGTFAFSNLTTTSNQDLAVLGTGLFLTVLLGVDALRTLWRN